MSRTRNEGMQGAETNKLISIQPFCSVSPFNTVERTPALNEKLALLGQFFSIILYSEPKQVEWKHIRKVHRCAL